MSALSGLGAFASGLAGGMNAKKDREEAAKQRQLQDRMLASYGATAQGGGMGATGATAGLGAMGAVPQGAGGGPVSAFTMPTSATASQIREGLIKRGMAPHIADGFVMNFQDESGLNPGAVGDNGNAFGLAQLNGPRRIAYLEMAKSKGIDPMNVDLQLDHLMYELNGPEAAAWRKIQAAQSAGAAGAAIVKYFERPAEAHRTRRAASYLAYDTSGAGASEKRAAVRDVLPGAQNVPDEALDGAIAKYEADGRMIVKRPMGAYGKGPQ